MFYSYSGVYGDSRVRSRSRIERIKYVLASIYGDIINGIAIYDWDVEVDDPLWICPVCGAQFISFDDLKKHIIKSKSEGHRRLKLKLARISRAAKIHGAEYIIIRIYRWIRV